MPRLTMSSLASLALATVGNQLRGGARYGVADAGEDRVQRAVDGLLRIFAEQRGRNTVARVDHRAAVGEADPLDVDQRIAIGEPEQLALLLGRRAHRLLTTVSAGVWPEARIIAV